MHKYMRTVRVQSYSSKKAIKDKLTVTVTWKIRGEIKRLKMVFGVVLVCRRDISGLFIAISEETGPVAAAAANRSLGGINNCKLSLLNGCFLPCKFSLSFSVFYCLSPSLIVWVSHTLSPSYEGIC